jgi:hypothetical protein
MNGQRYLRASQALRASQRIGALAGQSGERTLIGDQHRVMHARADAKPLQVLHESVALPLHQHRKEMPHGLRARRHGRSAQRRVPNALQVRARHGAAPLRVAAQAREEGRAQQRRLQLIQTASEAQVVG